MVRCLLLAHKADLQ